MINKKSTSQTPTKSGTSSSLTRSREMKKIKKSSLEESEEVKNLLDKISQHDDASPFKFATNEEDRLFHSLISIENENIAITTNPLYEEISNIFHEQLNVATEQSSSWRDYYSFISKLNKILTSQEDSRSMINEEIFAQLKDLPSQRIMTVYNEFLQSQKSLPDVWESTLMGMIVNILNHQFKFRKNIIFGTYKHSSIKTSQEAVQYVDSYAVKGTSLKNKARLIPDAFAQIHIFEDQPFVFFKCEGQRAETWTHKDHFKIYIEMKGMLKDYGIPFGYTIRESDIFNLSSTEGIVALTTFIESMCENVYNLEFNEEEFEENARLSSSSTPMRAKTQSLERIVKEMDVRFGTNMPSSMPTTSFETLEEGKRVSKKILSGMFVIGEQIEKEQAKASNIVYIFKTSNPYIFVRSFDITSFVGIFYWAETKFYDLRSYLFSLSIKKNQEQLWMKILDEHRSDDSRSRNEHEHDELSRNFHHEHNQQSRGTSFESNFKYIPDPMNEIECAIVLEELLALKNFQFLLNSMRCDTSCTSFYGSAFSQLYGPVFVKGTVFRTENESVMKRLVTLSQTRSTFSNIVRVFEYHAISSNSKLISVIFNLMKQHNDKCVLELRKLVNSTDLVSITILERLISLDDFMNMLSVRRWLNKCRIKFFMNLVRQCFEILFQLDQFNILHSDISFGNLMIRLDQDHWNSASSDEEKIASFKLVIIDFNSSMLLKEQDTTTNESEVVHRKIIPNQKVDLVFKYPYSEPSLDTDEADIYSMAVVIVNYLHYFQHRNTLNSDDPFQSCMEYKILMLDFLNDFQTNYKHMYGDEIVHLVSLLKYMLATGEEERPVLKKIKGKLEKVKSLWTRNILTRTPLKSISNPMTVQRNANTNHEFPRK
ncbi:hypothetical protein FDP41_012653 [Naegleria fowleri]|uniref:Protein kinase domain-containing protein n=1 Tax=Naegleria fowleri TaxID=5763 RepID=A0A6A5C5V8_NAEFO|nr:uncharacterized protein FDP41_012653 [Naegleria fowleri]KAF0980865.1 hypothetical protein FDP41_012653 [Naegleria fowleri]